MGGVWIMKKKTAYLLITLLILSSILSVRAAESIMLADNYDIEEIQELSSGSSEELKTGFDCIEMDDISSESNNFGLEATDEDNFTETDLNIELEIIPYDDYELSDEIDIAVDEILVEKIQLGETVYSETFEEDGEEDYVCGDGVKWSLSNGCLRIYYTGSGSGRMYDWISVSDIDEDKMRTEGGDSDEEFLFPPWTYVDGDADGKTDEIKVIRIENGITYIGSSAFEDCSLAEDTVIASSVKVIGANAFFGCTSLKNVIFDKGSNLKIISEDAFADCTDLKLINLPNMVESIGEFAFSNSGLTSIIIPEKVKKIAGSLLDGCTDLTSVTFAKNSSITEIGDRAFADCLNLSDFHIPSSVTQIGEGAFEYCSLLGTENLIIPDGVTSIEDTTFKGCSSLKGIIVPENIQYLGDEIFENCESLEHIILDGITLPEMTKDTFSDLEVSVYYPLENKSSAYTKEQMREYGTELSWIGWKIDKGMDEEIYVLNIDGYGAIGDFPKPDQADEIKTPWSYNTYVSDIVIGNKITSIGTYCFYDYAAAENVTIGSAVKEIHDYAFSNLGTEVYWNVGTEMIFKGTAPNISTKAFGDYEQIKNTKNIPWIDIYYSSDIAWQKEVQKNYENVYVSWIYSEEKELYDVDNGWKVNHSPENFANNGRKSDGYYFSSTDEEILYRNLSNSEKKSIQKKKTSWLTGDVYRYNLNGNQNFAGKDKCIEWKGNCLGLAHMVALINNGIIPNSYAGVKNSNVSDEVKSLIEFYHLQQYLPSRLDAQKAFVKQSQEQQLKILEEQLRNVTNNKENMVALDVQWINKKGDKGGHVLLAYALEEGRFWANDEWYDHRVLLYDVNEYGSSGQANYHTQALYYNGGQAEKNPWKWTIMGYGVTSTNNKISRNDSQNNAHFVMITAASAYMNAVDHETGTENILPSSTYMY